MASGIFAMPNAPQSWRLLKQVRRRLRWQAMLHAAYWSVLGTTVVYAAALLVSRGTGLIPDWFTVGSLALVPLAGGMLALLAHRRPAVQDSARAVDLTAGVKDLYLTLALLERSAGEYQPLVVQAAEDSATKIAAARVAPLRWQRRYWHPVALGALVALGMWGLPQWDPFGKVASASLVTLRKDRLADLRRDTQLRLAELKRHIDEKPEETAATEAIDSLKLALNKMEPQRKQENLEILMDEQKELAGVWKQLNADALKSLLKHTGVNDQQFGAADNELLNKLSQQLQEGSLDGLKQELQQLQDDLQKLAKTADPKEKQELQEKLREKLKTLDQFAKKNLDSKSLAAALDRAMKQLDLAQLEALSPEALEAALESVELAQLEADQLAEGAEDLQRIEEALKSLKLARRLNDREKLDGRLTQGKKSLADYEKLYQELLAQCEGECPGEGQCPGCAKCQGNQRGKSKTGMHGPGAGAGNVAPEDDSVNTEFQSEVAKSAVTAGKILFSQKTQGLGEKGAVTGEYRSLAKQVQQGVSDALEQEQIPPGYHEGVKRYFDMLEPANAKK